MRSSATGREPIPILDSLRSVSLLHRSDVGVRSLLSVTRRALVCIAGAAALAATGCGSTSATEAAAKKDVQPEYDQTGRLTRLAYDRNGDGKPDTWGYMDGSRVVRVEVDEDGDGKVDRWEYHTGDAATRPNAGGGASGRGAEGADAGDGVDPTLERIERATRHDGKVSRREYFDHGVLTRIEEDTDGDGQIDKWETYSNGTLAEMALDTKKRGRPDRRLVYRPDGSLSRIEADPAGTGAWHPLPQ
jgi:hypothetical protein